MRWLFFCACVYDGFMMGEGGCIRNVRFLHVLGKMGGHGRTWDINQVFEVLGPLVWAVMGLVGSELAGFAVA